MPVFQNGSINPTALLVPDLYVIIVPPSQTTLNGVPTNILGVVGSAAWGPVGSPVAFSDMADYLRKFGPIRTNKYDMGTMVATAVFQGANNFRGVRVTDGTDVAASKAILDAADATGVTAAAKYTGTLGNSVKMTVAAGSKANTFKVTIDLPGIVAVPEVFDNIPSATFWVDMLSAINEGQSGVRGPSDIVIITDGAGTGAPKLQSYTLVGGTDGITGVDSTDLVGLDTIPRSGMYALRNTGCSVALLAAADDTTLWTNQLAFGISEGIYMVMVGPAGQTIDAAITAKNTAGIEQYDAKTLFGDWCYFNDLVNGKLRLVSPQGYVAGRLINLSPEQSSLNKQIYGIVGTQKTMKQEVYSSAELGQLAAANLEVVTNPAPGGHYFACRFGCNTSTDAATNDDSYTRMTNYIAYTLNAGMGRFVGRVRTPEEVVEAEEALSRWLDTLVDANMIEGYTVSIRGAAHTPVGYQIAEVKVRYFDIVKKFIINVEGGATVKVVPES